MGQFEDLTGREFGRWKVLERGENYRSGATWVCECQCPLKTVKTVTAGNLRSGGSTNCGCKRNETLTRIKTKHGRSYGRAEYGSWQSMKKRCFKETDKSYPDYGGRGITVCDRWLGDDGFVNFLADLGDRPTPTSTLERKDVNGNYCPENCCWIERREQNKNRRATRWVKTKNGQEKRVADFAVESGVSNGAMHYRLKIGMPPEEAANKPVQIRHYKFLYRGEWKTPKELEAVAGVSAEVIKQRIRAYKWSVERATETPVGLKGKPPEAVVFRGVEIRLDALVALFGIPLDVLHDRLFRFKWSLEKSVSEPVELQCGSVPK